MSKNLNRRFFYDFLIQLANEACGTGEKENNPLVTGAKYSGFFSSRSL
jgi:hypothetical protein